MSEEYYWEQENFLTPRETPEERAARKEAYRQEKRNKKKRKPGEIPTYIKGRKEGMAREQQITDEWNRHFGPKKGLKKDSKIKPRFSLELAEEAEEAPETRGIEVAESFSTDAPLVFRAPEPAKEEAKRRPNSGAMWYAKGDISFEHALMEVKERGTVNARGQKTISIPKEWLTKQEDEAFLEGKPYWYLAFAYKGDPDVFLIKPYDQEMELIAELRRLQGENDALKNALDEGASN